MADRPASLSKINQQDSASTNGRYTPWKYVIPLPPDSLMWSVGGVNIENFLVVGDAWAQVVSRFTNRNTTMLDVGCGCGRTARVLVNNRWIKKYIGFDVIRANVDWCRKYVAPCWNGVAEFHWFDLYSGEYNPSGALKAEDCYFPCRDRQADVILAASVFTHLLEPDAIHYLREVGRCLSWRGHAILSIHNRVPTGFRFHGSEARIDMDPEYFLELANFAGLKAADRVDDLAGQMAFVFRRK